MTVAKVYDTRLCELGEGPLWHPERGQLFWFDILGQRLLSRVNDEALEWPWDEPVSAAGWLDHDRLLVASASALWTFEIDTGDRARVIDLEAENPATRSNDGRADPKGGFWIGTMGRAAEPAAGAIYRYFRGEVRKLYSDITIPNAICFGPDGKTAYFADTAKGIVWRQYVDRAGWPSGRPEVFLDFSGMGLNPDGAVCDAQGNLWLAQWGVGRVACHAPDGRFLRAVETGGRHSSCPAFGGEGLGDLYVTSATEHVTPEGMVQHPLNGLTFRAESVGAKGQAEHRVIL